MLFDHALEQALPRAYLASLLTRLEQLKSAKAATSLLHPDDGLCSPEDPGSTVRLASTSFDKHFKVGERGSRSLFFGASSAFTLTVGLLHHAISNNVLPSDAEQEPPTLGQLDAPDDVQLPQQAKLDVVPPLFELFLVSSNTLYGIVDRTAAEEDLQQYLSPHIETTTEGQAHARFRISMMCAVAAATRVRYQPSTAVTAMAFYGDALVWIEQVTSEVSVASLQALLLLIVFGLFYPRHVDIWKLLDYSCRLCIELGYHTEPAAPESETEAERKLRRSVFWGLYAIERIVGQLLGRPSDLPEQVITTEYPNVVGAFNDAIGQNAAQPVAIAHHYRLVYLRSEIFRDIYLPASPCQFNIEWYKERFYTLYTWRQEFAVSEDLTGVATITCDVGFHSSICFLLQPLMLQALRDLEKSAVDRLEVASVPQDNYVSLNGTPSCQLTSVADIRLEQWSACELIKVYEKVMRSPESSSMGAYPITILSAHYIYLAGMTLMAHALVAIDGRLTVYESLAHSADGTVGLSTLDFSNILQVSNACLVLLTSCAERWPGMDGMLHVYRKLADRVLVPMLRRAFSTT